MASDWIETTLGALGTFRNGVNFNRDQEGAGIPVLKVKDFGDRSLVPDSGLDELTEDKVPISRDHYLNAGDTVIMRSNGNPALVGRSMFFRGSSIPVTFSGFCIRFRPDTSRVHPRFAAYLIRSPYFRERFSSHGSGTGITNLSQDLLASVPVELPCLDEQLSIAQLLGALDDRIERGLRTSEQMELIARAIFKSWFVDFDPVRAKAEGREPEGMDAATAALFPDKFEYSETAMVPAGWNFVLFGELLIQTIGGDWGKDKPDEKHTERVAIIRGTDMPTIRSGFASGVGARYRTEKELESRALADGDIVIEVSGGSPTQPTGRSIFITASTLARFSTPVLPASFCRLFRPKNLQIGTLLTQHLGHIYAEGKMWGYQNQSTGISNFQTKHFLEVEEVCVPSEEVLSAFHELVRPMLDRQQVELAQTLSELRDTLLPRLISGKLRVPEAEKLMEAVL